MGANMGPPFAAAAPFGSAPFSQVVSAAKPLSGLVTTPEPEMTLAPPVPIPALREAAGVAGSSEGCHCEGSVEQELAPQCKMSKVVVREDHGGEGDHGMTLSDVSAVYGGGEPALSQAQRGRVIMANLASTPFRCLDDRVTKPSIATPGGDLGEFVLALSNYYQERSAQRPSQASVDSFLVKYVEMLPPKRPLIMCTDERAVAHLETVMPVENLDLSAPPLHVIEAGLLEKLTDVESQGDTHFRLMLKHPEWYQLEDYLVPMVLKAFYSNLWKQKTDPQSPLYGKAKLELELLPFTAESSPQAFFEVSASELCRDNGAVPLMVPHDGTRNVLISQLDAASARREELAAFFSRLASATPQKVDKERLHQRLDRHGWLALETTGSRIAAGIPFYTLNYV